MEVCSARNMWYIERVMDGAQLRGSADANQRCQCRWREKGGCALSDRVGLKKLEKNGRSI